MFIRRKSPTNCHPSTQLTVRIYYADFLPIIRLRASETSSENVIPWSVAYSSACSIKFPSNAKAMLNWFLVALHEHDEVALIAAWSASAPADCKWDRRTPWSQRPVPSSSFRTIVCVRSSSSSEDRFRPSDRRDAHATPPAPSRNASPAPSTDTSPASPSPSRE